MNNSSPSSSNPQPFVPERVATPYSQESITISKQEYVDLKWKIGHLQSQLEDARAKNRELKATLEKEREESQAKICSGLMF